MRRRQNPHMTKSKISMRHIIINGKLQAYISLAFVDCNSTLVSIDRCKKTCSHHPTIEVINCFTFNYPKQSQIYKIFLTIFKYRNKYLLHLKLCDSSHFVKRLSDALDRSTNGQIAKKCLKTLLYISV